MFELMETGGQQAVINTRVFNLVLSERVSELARVDLRYERGLAVSWRLRASAAQVKS